MCIDIEGLKIEYKISGCEDENAPVAVILQGWGTSYALYNIVADAISDKYKVIQFDLPGFGASTEPDRSWSVSDYTEFFVKFLNPLFEYSNKLEALNA